VAERRTQISTRTRVIGRTVNAAVTHAPWLWPLLRGRVQGYFDDLASSWDERTGAGSVDHLQALATATAGIRPAPERVLDIGTGTGEAALFLAREFPRAGIRGIDVSERMIRQAQAKVGLDPDGRVAFRVADASDLPYDEESFDLISQLNMPPFFGEVARVLRPAGHVIVVATGGPATPFYTPPAVLERGFRRYGIETVDTGQAGRGEFFIGRAGRG
jgi:ubiquinone/menaquinone biosynthesis C-methylase UbiE